MTHKPTTTTASAADDDNDDDVEARRMGFHGRLGGWVVGWLGDTLETTMTALPPHDTADVNGELLNARCSGS